MRNEVIFMFFYTGIPVMMAAAAVVMDLRTARVDNGWILFCMAAGLAMRILANGIIGVFWYFTGALIPVVLLGWLFVFRMLGPGDIKLLSVIGGILGAGEIVKCILGAMFIGAAISAALLISNGNICQRFLYLWSYICQTARTGKRKSYYQKGMLPLENFHFTVPVFLSVLLYAGGVY